MSDWADDYSKLLATLKPRQRCAVAFSGGVDSTLLLKACIDALGADQVMAITADAPMHARAELREASALANRFGATHVVIPLAFADIPGLTANPTDRCYRCKQAVLSRCRELLAPGYTLCEGSNQDDLAAHRPGWQAVRELGVASPLVEAGLSKQSIRELSRELGLPTWDKPSQSCLLTRFPYDSLIDVHLLTLVERSEDWLARLGFVGCRVRYHDNCARVEVQPEQLRQVQSEPIRSQIIDYLHTTGFRQVQIDPLGYRSGSMDQN